MSKKKKKKEKKRRKKERCDINLCIKYLLSALVCSYMDGFRQFLRPGDSNINVCTYMNHYRLSLKFRFENWEENISRFNFYRGLFFFFLLEGTILKPLREIIDCAIRNTTYITICTQTRSHTL